MICSSVDAMGFEPAVTTVDSGRRALEILGLAGEDSLHVSLFSSVSSYA